MRNFRFRLEQRAQRISKFWYEKLLLMATLLGDRHDEVRRREYINTYLRSKGGVEGMATAGVGHWS
jgi:hypothetical protein